MCWDYPNRGEEYRVPNQYLFGSELMVVPITEPQDPEPRLARARGWLPPGRYVDIFSGAVYEGDREVWLSRAFDWVSCVRERRGNRAVRYGSEAW